MEEKIICLEKNAINFAGRTIEFNPIFKNYSYKDFKETMNILCNISFVIFFICYGFLQSFVIWSALAKAFYIDNIFTILISLVLGFFPFVGTFLGIYGAHIAWGWAWLPSSVIFIAPYFLANGPLLLIAFFDIYKDWLRWQEEEMSNV